MLDEVQVTTARGKDVYLFCTEGVLIAAFRDGPGPACGGEKDSALLSPENEAASQASDSLSSGGGLQIHFRISKRRLLGCFCAPPTKEAPRTSRQPKRARRPRANVLNMEVTGQVLAGVGAYAPRKAPARAPRPVAVFSVFLVFADKRGDSLEVKTIECRLDSSEKMQRIASAVDEILTL